jgi:hypothetical protein
MKQLAEIECPMFGDKCRFCSDERVTQRRQFSVIRDCALGKKGHVGTKRVIVEFGLFCNADGRHFVREMKYCPSRFAKTMPGVMTKCSSAKIAVRKKVGRKA